MLQNYIFFNGKRYYAGSVFIVNCMGKESEAVLIGYNNEYASYFFKINNKTCRMTERVFKNSFVRATDKVVCHHIPAEQQRKDFDIDGMFLGWVWYIFLMAVSVIFKSAILLWIIISVVFFNWRAKKIQKEGMYVEW